MREDFARDRTPPQRRPAKRGTIAVRMPRLFGLVRHHPGDTFCTLAAAGAIAAIVTNALFLQPGQHPAPIFAIRPLPVVSREAAEMTQMPKPRPVAAVSKSDPAKSEPAKSEPAKSEPAKSEPAKPEPGPRFDVVPLPRPRVQAAAPALRADPIAELIGPAHQVSTVQRVLNEFGYGPIKVSGTFDEATRQGIERFERDHNLPVTGQNSPRLRHAISQATGRSLD